MMIFVYFWNGGRVLLELKFNYLPLQQKNAAKVNAERQMQRKPFVLFPFFIFPGAFILTKYNVKQNEQT